MFGTLAIGFARTWLYKSQRATCPVRSDAYLTAAAYWMVEAHFRREIA